MLVRARELGALGDAARLAAILSERDPLGREAGADLETRVAALRQGRSGARWQRLRELARRLAGAAGDDCKPGRKPGHSSIGGLLALAYPDRIGQRRPGGPPRYRLSNGRGAWLADDDPLGASDWLVAAELDGRAREARIFLGARIGVEEIENLLAARIETTEEPEWDEARGTVVVRRRRKLGALVLGETEVGRARTEQLAEGLLGAVRRQGIDRLNWSERARQFTARIERVRRALHPDWPAFDRESLERELDQWLGPFLAGMTHLRQVAALDLLPCLEARLDHSRKRELDRLAPTHLDVPSGHSVALDWCAESGPVLAVKLQAVFGWEATPRVLDGRTSVVLHLLSPAGRPLAITADLASFWANAYPEVAKDMRGRYPKHPWPVDPTSAVPTLATRRRGG
jgi:ATP-dependent helicase HrpB